MKDAQKQLETLRERIENGERDIDDQADREALIEFSDQLYLLAEEYGAHRHLKLLRICTRMAEHVGGLKLALENRDRAEEIVRWIHQEYDLDDPDVSEETNRDYRVALRIFGKRMPPDDEIPDSISWVSAQYSRDYDPSPNPADMLEWGADVKAMIDAARNPRDEALIALQFDAGLRSGELFDLTMGDISESKYSKKIRVDGKQGERSVDLIPSIPYLNRWLSEHPAPDDSDAPLWSKLTDPELISYNRFLQCFKECARRAGVDKPVTPTNFRKSNATWLAKQGANEALINTRQGRKQGNDTIARYVSQFGEDAEILYAEMHGKDVDREGSEDIGPIECPRCGRDTPQDESYCVWCNLALSPDAADETQQQDERLVKSAAQADEDVAEDIIALREMLSDRPALRSVLVGD